jgi:hypothetical protein
MRPPQRLHARRACLFEPPVAGRPIKAADPMMVSQGRYRAASRFAERQLFCRSWSGA